MCRYGLYGPYKSHFACFECRKAFKRWNEREWPARERPHPDETVPALCPDCARPMADMGLDFQAPPQRDVERWQVAAFLFQRGYAYHCCGCGGPGYRPSRWSDVPAFLDRAPQSPGKVLAARYAHRRR